MTLASRLPIKRINQAAARSRARRPKYGNQRVVAGGVMFDSKLERDYAAELELKRRAGRVEWWSYGPRYLLQDQPLITYRPDFLVKPAGEPLHAVDCKGIRTQAFQLKRRLWAAIYPDIELRIVGKNRSS